MRTWYRNLDYLTIFAWMVVVSIGLIAIYSTTNGPACQYLLESVQRNFWRQLTCVFVSLAVVVFCLMLPGWFFQKAAYAAYFTTLMLLRAALLCGREVNGAK